VQKEIGKFGARREKENYNSGCSIRERASAAGCDVEAHFLELYTHNKKPNLQGRVASAAFFLSLTQRASAKNLFLARAEKSIMLCSRGEKNLPKAILYVIVAFWSENFGRKSEEKKHSCMTYILENNPRALKGKGGLPRRVPRQFETNIKAARVLNLAPGGPAPGNARSTTGGGVAFLLRGEQSVKI
jgi:hypothetical protein